jgi:hypothetical protein
MKFQRDLKGPVPKFQLAWAKASLEATFSITLYMNSYSLASSTSNTDTNFQKACFCFYLPWYWEIPKLLLDKYNKKIYILTYDTRYTRRGRRDISDLRDDTVLPKRSKGFAGVIGSKPIAVWAQSISSVIANNPLVAFCDIHAKKERFYSSVIANNPLVAFCDIAKRTGAIILCCTGHHTEKLIYIHTTHALSPKG